MKKLPNEVLDYFREQGRKGGLIGGKKALESMTPTERVERAKRASDAASEARRLKAAAKSKPAKAKKRSSVAKKSS